jgi:uncharacterized membrane protein
MDITSSTLTIVLACASLVVIAMLIHYVMRVGRSHDMLCISGMLAASFGLLMAARVKDTPVDLFSAMSFGFALFVIALTIWREGLKRFRDAG